MKYKLYHAYSINDFNGKCQSMQFFTKEKMLADLKRRGQSSYLNGYAYIYCYDDNGQFVKSISAFDFYRGKDE